MKKVKPINSKMPYAVGLLLSFSAFADAQINRTIRTNSASALRSAVRAANAQGGGTITISIPAGENNVFNLRTPPQSFFGNGGADVLNIRATRRVTFDGRGATNILQISGRDNRLVVENVTFRNGNSDGSNLRQGGGIGTLNTDRNNFIDVVNCNFIDCRTTRSAAGGGGGGIRCRIGNRLRVFDSVFTRCIAPTGGGIAVTDSNAEIRRSEFRRCESTGAPDGVNNGMRQLNANGGGVRLDSPSESGTRTLVVAGCEFVRNVRAESETSGGVALNVFSAVRPPRGQVFAIINNNTFRANVGDGPTARVFVGVRQIGPQSANFVGNVFTDNDTERNVSNANVTLLR